MNAKERAHQLRRIVNDDIFKEMMKEVIERQTAVFLNSSATMQEIERAHHVIKGVHAVEAHIESVFNAEAIYDKKQ
jgi:hypothetical protein